MTINHHSCRYCIIFAVQTMSVAIVLATGILYCLTLRAIRHEGSSCYLKIQYFSITICKILDLFWTPPSFSKAFRKHLCKLQDELHINFPGEITFPDPPRKLMFYNRTKHSRVQYILYSDVHPRSKWKSKVRKVKGQASISPLYSTTDTFTDSCVNIILQKFISNRTRVKHDFQQKSKVKADFSLTVHLDRGWRSKYSEHWSAIPLTLFNVICAVLVVNATNYMEKL